ncbi:MAG: (2Fe-2S)-binding protein [Acidobacteria bacterium]|nr:(2Fe-2S)-binding protein [Acidobacteriota bacterium]
MAVLSTAGNAATMTKDTARRHRTSFTRRNFLKGLGALSATVSAGGLTFPVLADGTEAAAIPAEYRASLVLRVNDSVHRLQVPNRATLLDVLRDELGLTGAKPACSEGHCGACTVLVDRQPVYSCSQLAVLIEGRDVLTVEGLEKNGKLDPVQQAFIDADAMQCGYCIPGQIMSARALLDANPSPGTDEVRKAMCGNICRCGAYMNILKAVTGGRQDG